jgi:hypothetical protein
MNEFSQETAEAIKSYVYALLDTRRRKDDVRRIFYVGKGKGQRCFQHAHAAIKPRKSSDGPNPKLELIHEIHRDKKKWPQIEIIQHGLTDEAARLLEAIMIKALRTDPSRRKSKRERDAACNRAAGQGAGTFCLSTEDVEAVHSHPLPEGDLESRVLLVSLNGGPELCPFPEIDERDLPRRVLRYWRLAPENAAIVDYIAGVYRQVVRVVFKVQKDHRGRAIFRRYYFGKSKDGKRIFGTAFSGQPCPDKEKLWCNRRIMRGDDTLTKFAPRQACKLVGREDQQ